jgi:hypothetical protein
MSRRYEGRWRTPPTSDPVRARKHALITIKVVKGFIIALRFLGVTTGLLTQREWALRQARNATGAPPTDDNT